MIKEDDIPLLFGCGCAIFGSRPQWGGVLTAINTLLTTLTRQPCKKLHRTALTAARAANRRVRKYIRLRISAIVKLVMEKRSDEP